MTSEKSDKGKFADGWDHWEHLIETTPDPIAIVDAEFVVRHFNKPFAALVPDFKSGGRFRDIVLPEHQANWDACLRDSFNNRVMSAHVAVRSGELVRYLAVRVLPVLDGGKPSKFLVICIDVTDTMNFETELRKRDALLQKAEQIGEVGSWIWNVTSSRGYWSDNLYRIVGYEPQSFSPTAETILERTHPDDLKTLNEVDQKIAARLPGIALETIEFEYRMLRHQGGYVNLLCRCEIHRDDIGDAVQVTGVILNITERMKLLQSLSHSEARWQFALENAEDGLWDWNPQTDEVFFSSRWKSMLGYEDHEIRPLGEEWSCRVHPDDLPQCYADLEKHFKGEAPIYHNEHRIRCKDGTYKWILARGKVVERKADGTPIRIVGTHTDMTEIRRAEQALKESEALLDAAGRMAKVGGWELDVKTSKVTWTTETYRIHDVPFDQRPPLEDAINFYHPEDRPTLRLALENAIKHGHPFDLELRFISAAGRELLTRAICTPVYQDGEVVKLVGTFQDITKVKQMELALITANENLKQKHQDLEEKNVALRVILSQIQDERDKTNQQIAQNLERIIKPSLMKLRASVGERGRTQIDALESALAEVTSPFVSDIEKQFVNLTPREMEVCNHIKNGFRSKEIADLLNISVQTVEKFRQKIRKKLKIDGSSANLSSFLRARHHREIPPEDPK